MHQGPAGLRLEPAGVKAGFLQKLAGDAAGEIEHPLRGNVHEVGRAAGEIDRAGIGRGRRHYADQISAIGGSQRRSGENVEHAGVGKIPIAPRQEAGVIRLEAGTAQHAVAYRIAVEQQQPAIPQRRLRKLAAGKVPLDLRTARVREFPSPRLDRNFRTIDRNDFGRNDFGLVG